MHHQDRAYDRGMIKAVVFDLGEVLASPPSLLPELASRIGTSVEELREHYWAGRADYDAGRPEHEYWGALLDALGKPWDEEIVADLALLDASVWSQLRPTAWQLLRDCRSAGVTVAILSNSAHAMQRVAGRSRWRADVDHLFISATLGLMKPDPEIYRVVAVELALEPSQLAFVDDKPANVEAARELGWNGHVWLDDENTRVWLQGLGVLPA